MILWIEANFIAFLSQVSEKAVAPHSSTLAWKIPWTEEPGRLQSMGSLKVGHDWATSLSLFTFMHWRRQWQPTRVLAWRIPGKAEPGGLPSMTSHRVRQDWSDLAAAASQVYSGNNYICLDCITLKLWESLKNYFKASSILTYYIESLQTFIHRITAVMRLYKKVINVKSNRSKTNHWWADTCKIGCHTPALPTWH